MANRALVKKRHEDAVLEDFVAFLNHRFKARYSIEARPDPPEAIIRGSRRRRWVEVADVFYSRDYAHDILSYATPGERHHDTSGIVQYDVDGKLARQFVSILQKKVMKKSYLSFRERYGPGLLLLVINHPWFDDRTVWYMKNATRAASWEKDLGCFSSVYFSFRLGSGWSYKRWRYA